MATPPVVLITMSLSHENDWSYVSFKEVLYCLPIPNPNEIQLIYEVVSLEAKFTKQRLPYFGHVKSANSLEKSIMLGVISSP